MLRLITTTWVDFVEPCKTGGSCGQAREPSAVNSTNQPKTLCGQYADCSEPTASQSQQLQRYTLSLWSLWSLVSLVSLTTNTALSEDPQHKGRRLGFSEEAGSLSSQSTYEHSKYEEIYKQRIKLEGGQLLTPMTPQEIIEAFLDPLNDPREEAVSNNTRRIILALDVFHHSNMVSILHLQCNEEPHALISHSVTYKE